MSSTLLDSATGQPFPQAGDKATGAALVKVVNPGGGGEGGGTLSAQANAALQTSAESADTDPMSMDLRRRLRVTDDQVLAELQTMAADPTPAVTVGLTKVATASFTRPGNATVCVAGNLFANSITAGSVVALAFTMGATNANSGMIRKARIRKSSHDTNAVPHASFRLHLFSAAPTTAGGDATTFSNVSGYASYLGSFDVLVDRLLGDGSVGTGPAHNGGEVNYVTGVTDNKLYGLLEVTDIYMPGNSETISVDLEFLPNAA